MEKVSEITSATMTALYRKWWLWIIIIVTIYVFSLYIYFFPTPLTQPFVSGPATTGAKNSIRR